MSLAYTVQSGIMKYCEDSEGKADLTILDQMSTDTATGSVSFRIDRFHHLQFCSSFRPDSQHATETGAISSLPLLSLKSSIPINKFFERNLLLVHP